MPESGREDSAPRPTEAERRAAFAAVDRALCDLGRHVPEIEEAYTAFLAGEAELAAALLALPRRAHQPTNEAPGDVRDQEDASCSTATPPPAPNPGRAHRRGRSKAT